MSKSSDKQSLALRWRRFKDLAARNVVTVGGLSVIGAILLIMFYLFYVVVPMFLPASVDVAQTYSVPKQSDGTTTFLSIDEQVERAGRFTDTGKVVFFDAQNGNPLGNETVRAGRATSFTLVDDVKSTVAYGYEDGAVTVAKIAYKTRYENVDVTADNPNGLKRIIEPVLEYPLGGELELYGLDEGVSIDKLSVVLTADRMATAAWNAESNVIRVTSFSIEESFFGDGFELEEESQSEIQPRINPDYVIVDPLTEWLYVADKNGQLDIYDINAGLELYESEQVVDSGEQLTSFEMLRGGISLMVGSSSGEIAQWFLVRDENNKYHLKKVRGFADNNSDPIEHLSIEHRRKGFASVSKNGVVGIHYASSGRELYSKDLFEIPVQNISISPRANAALIETADNKITVLDIHNEHPEVSFAALWSEIWYENYQEPDYIWQSSAANDDFEPKFSLTPLAFGTFKAAFYAMLMALPLAIAGAVYTAYFMSPGLRQVVKPVIEIMEALPTVILGFLAGLWLAPLMEEKLVGAFLILVTIPLFVILFGFIWDKTPEKIRLILPTGWQPVILVPVVIVAAGVAYFLSDPIEAAFMGGNASQFLTNSLGIDYDQRNSMVVGFAMGFAVIPTIFSITEDAVFGVPKALSNGSLALGATPWQTLVRVVLPTASPGMFSAVMIGMGRAVGETMIVLMATGNTPIMDFNIFEGMRTLSANIAVEMPESEVDSTHYRILFLAGLVLFIFTFMFNTVAELVRQRLREKYSTI